LVGHVHHAADFDMSGVITVEIPEKEGGQRLDRWLRNRYPGLGQGKLQKLLRTGQIRVDGARAKAGDRVDAGQSIRIPPNIESPRDQTAAQKRSRNQMDAEDVERIGNDLKDRVLYMDDNVLAIDKPYGLAVQGGTGTKNHVDGVLDRLKLGAGERPRLVHRLDRDTTGVLLLARNRQAAVHLGDIFKARDTRKIYWALVDGHPRHDEGLIDAPLSKLPGKHGERMRVDFDDGKHAETRFRVIDHAGKAISWLELEPFTGRTHQLRVHCEVLETPIVGDPKYGRGATSDLAPAGIEARLHLHAHRLIVPYSDKKVIDVIAPLPAHMQDSWSRLGFDAKDDQAQLVDL